MTKPFLQSRRVFTTPWGAFLTLWTFLILGLSSYAAPIEVGNHSFQLPELPTAGGNTWINDLPPLEDPASPQWIVSETGDQFVELIGGFFDEGDQHIGTAAGKYLFQNLGIPYEANTAYTLTAAIGYRNSGQSGAEAFTVVGLTVLDEVPSEGNTLAGADTNEQLDMDSLLRSNHVRIDSVAFHEAKERSFGDVTVELVTDDNPPAGNIVIFLGDDNEGGRSHFDNIRLESTSAIDADGDAIPAEWETGTDRGVARNLDPAVDDGGDDPDGDTLTNFQEFEAGTHPRLADTDGDGLNDNVENTTDPLDPDADGDTLLDGAEIFTHNTDPADSDSDDDTFEDQAEIAAGTDPLDAGSRPARGGAILVGANFVGGDAENAGGTVTGSAGVVPQENWNNLSGGTGFPITVNASDGEPSLIRVSWETNGPFIAGDPPAAGNQGGQLMHGILLPRGEDTEGDNIATKITLSNIAYPFYDLIVYLNADEGGGRYIVNDQEYAVAEVTPYDGEFVEVTQEEDGVGNYIRFEMLSGSTTEIISRQLAGGGGISGFQIERQEPADPSLLPIPEVADFGVFDGNPGPQEITVRMLNPGLTQTLNISNSTISGDAAANFSITEVPTSLAPGEGADVVVTFNPTDAVGIYRASLDITSNDAVTGSTSISLIGQIKHANGLLAHYPMDETSGTVMEDSSGNGFHGSYISGSGSVTFGADALASGTAVSLSEGNDAAYAEIAADAGFTSQAQATYSFWVQQDAADVGTATVLFSRSASPANPYAVFFESTGGPDPVTWTSEASSETLASEPFIAPGETFHLVYTYSDPDGDGTAKVSLYVNGELNASDNDASGYPLNTIAPFQIGGSAGLFGLTGVIDDFQVYEKVLSESDIAAMYADPGSRAPAPAPDLNSGPTANLIGYWPADEGSGTAVSDAAGNFAGTLSAGDWTADGGGHTGISGDAAFLLTGEDGGASVVEVPTLGQVFTEITISGWIRGSQTGDWSGIFQSRDGSQPIGLGYRAGSGELAYTWNDNNAETYNFASSLVIPVDEWAFVALTLTPESATLYLGANGELNSATNAIPHIEQSSLETPWHFGKDNCCGTERNFQGAMDDIAIWDGALSQDQISSLFDGSATPLTVFSGGGAAVDVLVNGGFEDPVLNNINTNNLGTAPTGWSQTGADATWNLIRNDGSPYGSGVDTAAEGSQILDLNGIFEIFQSFTLTETSDITFGASFANREGHDGSDPSTVGIYDAAGTTLLSPVASVDTSADPTPSDVWRSGEATVTGLAPGEYQIRIAVNNFNNVDAAFARATAAGSGDPRDALGVVARSDGALTEPTLVDFGELSADSTLEFFFNAVKSGPSTAIAGNTAWGLKLDQWNETGFIGTTEFGVVDNTSEAPAVFDADVHVVFVSDTATAETRIYVNGALAGSTPGNPAMSGEGAVMGARDGTTDPFGEGSVMYHWATYNTALSEDDIAALAADSFGASAVGPSAPEIGSVNFTGDGLNLSLPAGTTYDIEFSSDLQTWTVIASEISGSYSDANAARIGGSEGYYRGVVK